MTDRLTQRVVCALAGVFALLLTCGPGAAQSLSIGGTTPAATSPPGIVQEGIFATTPVRVDGTQLFRIAIVQSPTLSERDAQFALSLRSQVTQAAISQVLAEKAVGGGTIYDPASLKVVAATSGAEPVISVVDADHQTPLPLLTVSEGDAQYNRVPIEELTTRWLERLQTALREGLRSRQPESYARSATVARWLVFVLVAVTVILTLVYVYFRRRLRVMRAAAEVSDGAARRAQSDLETVDESDEERRHRLVAEIAGGVAPRTRLRLLQSTLAAIVWFGVALWIIGILIVLSLFPATTPLALELVERVIAIAAILVVAALLHRLADVIMQRFFLSWQNAGPPDERMRRALRTPTIVSAVNGFSAVFLYFIAVLAILSQLGFSAISVLAVGGLVAVAFSLAAQNLMLDIVNGFFVLVEDQYAVGDFVVIGLHEGRVEYVSLRIVRIRDDQGGVVTIPHGQAKIVVNESRLWSRSDYRVTIANSSDVERALEIVRRTIDAIAGDEEWRSTDIDLEWIGVQAISRLGVVIRARVRTAPGEQWRVSRELHRLLAAAFAEAKIELGVDPSATVATPPPQ